MFLPVLGGNGLHSSKCNFILTVFGIEKRKSYFCVWLTLAYFERKRIIFFKVRLYTPTFRNRKSGQKIFAAQTPQRKRGFFSTHQTIVGKTFLHLRNSLFSLADATHCSMMWSVQNFSHIGTSVIFYIILQSTGLIFLPSSLSRDDFAECYFYV